MLDSEIHYHLVSAITSKDYHLGCMQGEEQEVFRQQDKGGALHFSGHRRIFLHSV